MKNGKSRSKPKINFCVFCGSGEGKNPKYAKAAEKLGAKMAKADIGLVYGGGSLGLMGITAKSVLDNNGYVTGIIPEFLGDREMMLQDVNELIVTKDMHERKGLMFKHSDAFIALPGGVGTLEELVEQLTWSQLGQHKKPIYLADIDSFWDPLIDLVNHMREERFIRPGLELNYKVLKSVDRMVPSILSQIEKIKTQEKRQDKRKGKRTPDDIIANF